MLATLKIRNLALVEELVWDLPAGFVAITGETGAGKSVILGALKFLLGEPIDLQQFFFHLRIKFRQFTH